MVELADRRLRVVGGALAQGPALTHSALGSMQLRGNWSAEGAWVAIDGVASAASSLGDFSPPESECDEEYPLKIWLSGDCPMDAPQLDAHAAVYRGSSNDTPYCGDRWAEMIQSAINLLRANLDIVRWLSCGIYGRFAELVDAIEDDSLAVNCEKDTDEWDDWSDWLRQAMEDLGFEDPGPLAGACCSSARAWLGGPVTLCTDANGIAQLARAWVKGGEADQWCVRLDLAATMLHELTHVTGYSTAADSAGSDCGTSSSYALENSLRWALLKRYASEVEGSDCENVAVRSLWRSRSGTFLLKDGRFEEGFDGCFEA